MLQVFQTEKRAQNVEKRKNNNNRKPIHVISRREARVVIQAGILVERLKGRLRCWFSCTKERLGGGAGRESGFGGYKSHWRWDGVVVKAWGNTKNFLLWWFFYLSERAPRVRVGKVAGLEDEKQIWDMLQPVRAQEATDSILPWPWNLLTGPNARSPHFPKCAGPAGKHIYMLRRAVIPTRDSCHHYPSLHEWYLSQLPF